MYHQYSHVMTWYWSRSTCCAGSQETLRQTQQAAPFLFSPPLTVLHGRWPMTITINISITFTILNSSIIIMLSGGDRRLDWSWDRGGKLLEASIRLWLWQNPRSYKWPALACLLQWQVMILIMVMIEPSSKALTKSKILGVINNGLSSMMEGSMSLMIEPLIRDGWLVGREAIGVSRLDMAVIDQLLHVT